MISQTKQITINGRFLTQSLTGVQRYALELIKGLNAMCENGMIDLQRYSFRILAPHGIKHDINLVHFPLTSVGFTNGHVWEQIELPLYARGGLLVNLCNTAPLVIRNQIVTVHDASVFGFPQAYSFLFRMWYRLLLKRIDKTALRIITDSCFSQDELVKHCGISRRKIQVIALGKEHVLKREMTSNIIEKHALLKDGYILAVSSLSSNKNFRSIVAAIELMDNTCFDIVIAGGTNSRVFGRTAIPEFNRIKHVGYVTDDELITLYKNAACFIYPSYYEGFGLPPLEAMANGCPVIVAHSSSLPEVCGDAAIYCDPYSPEDIAAKIRLLMHDSNLRGMMRMKGLERARHFTWKKCAQETWSIIEQPSVV